MSKFVDLEQLENVKNELSWRGYTAVIDEARNGIVVSLFRPIDREEVRVALIDEPWEFDITRYGNDQVLVKL